MPKCKLIFFQQSTVNLNFSITAPDLLWRFIPEVSTSTSRKQSKLPRFVQMTFLVNESQTKFQSNNIFSTSGKQRKLARFVQMTVIRLLFNFTYYKSFSNIVNSFSNWAGLRTLLPLQPENTRCWQLPAKMEKLR